MYTNMLMTPVIRWTVIVLAILCILFLVINKLIVKKRRELAEKSGKSFKE
ncbi:hypothetical protein GCM10010911_12930 [Paenibacillus nasutitermitis]|uniref:Uncharacterized protein n=1 Tax=Paenibacillus nasutitermitis TaxID=1652958 RepID=A0A917DP54_9BACL|nr:hypothetical protein GCM10010911_12930 [Paenibacillus nasutitermitis]